MLAVVIERGLFSRAPKRVDATKVLELALDASDGFLLSRIDGVTSAEDLCHLVGKNREQLGKDLDRLEALGAIVWRDESSKARVVRGHGAQTPRASPGGGAGSTLPGIDEISALDTLDISALDLDRDTLRELLEAEARLAVSYWHALGVDRDASRREIKKAFFKFSKRFHPDRFFGKELGPWRVRLERLFTGMKNASDTLTHPKKRQAYERRHGSDPVGRR